MAYHFIGHLQGLSRTGEPLVKNEAMQRWGESADSRLHMY